MDTPADTSVGGLQDKLEKVFPHTNTGDTISWTDSEMGEHETCFPPPPPPPEKVKALTKKCQQVLQHQ